MLQTAYNRSWRALFHRGRVGQGSRTRRQDIALGRLGRVQNVFNTYRNNILRTQGIQAGDNPRRQMFAARNADRNRQYSRRTYMGLANANG